MKTVTTAFTDMLRTVSPAFVRQVWYKRRYWQESSKSYIWEGSWTQLTEGKNISQSSDITWQLDIQTLNQFKSSNITINVASLANEWKADNPFGIFAKDAVSPVYGYEAFWTKFQVRAGVIKGDNTTEVVPVFTGVATEYNLDSSTGMVQVNVIGEEALLINANAENVSTLVTGETVGTGDGSTKVFTTANPGVGIVKEVSTAGIAKRLGVDVTISALNDSVLGATLTYAVAPGVGATVRATYLYWKSSQKFETLVALLLTQAGIAGGNQNVSPVIFPSNIINSHAWQTQADWNGGNTLTVIDTVSIPNSIEYLYSSASSINSTTSGWTSNVFSSGVTFGTDGSGLVFTSGASVVGNVSAYQAQTNTVGDFILQIQSKNTVVSTDFQWSFMANAVDTISAHAPNWIYQGYAISIHFGGGTGASNFLNLCRTDSAGTGLVTLFGAFFSTVAGGTAFTLKVRRRPGGVFSVYVNGVLLGTATDNTYTTSTYQGYGLLMNQNDVIHVLNNGFALPTSSTNPATWRSATVDFGSTPTAWSQFVWSQVLNSGSTTYYTRSSADNITYDAWTVVPANGAIASTLRRYIQARVDIDITAGDPVIASISLGAITSSTVITLANFTGMTCYDAITALGTFANYEYGFGPDEVFYFRPKSVSKTSVMIIDQVTYNMQLEQVLNGYDRVYSIVRATYGSYQTDVADDGQNYAGPLPRIGANRLAINGGNILISKDADVATGVAGSFFNYFKYPRRRIKVLTKCIPQLDLSDVISITFADNNQIGWYIGDNSKNLGDLTLSLYGGGEEPLSQLIAKVIGMRIDTENWQTEFDLEEVI